MGKGQTNRKLFAVRFLVKIKKTTTALSIAEQRAQPYANWALEDGSC